MPNTEEHRNADAWRQRWTRIGGVCRRGLGLAVAGGYRFCYRTGLGTVRWLRRFGKGLWRLLTPIGRLAGRAADRLVLRHARAIAAECRRIGEGFALAVQRVKAAYGRHPLQAVGQALLLPWLALRRHRRAVFGVLNLAAPVAAAFVLAVTVQFWQNTTFALALDYEGERLGYIADESVFETAANMAYDRVINTDNSFEVERIPKLTIAVAPKTQILDEAAVCDRILRSSGDAIQQASGLYVDGSFEGAVASRTALDDTLTAIRGQYKTKESDRTAFLQDVQIVDGLYPTTTVVDIEQMRDFLTSETVVEKTYTVVKGDSVSRIASLHDMSMTELRALNPGLKDAVTIGQNLVVQRAQPYLRVQVLRTVEYTEKIDYQTTKVEDAKQYLGYEAVRTQGQEGQKKITAEVTLVDGVEQSRKVLSTEVVKQPVNKVVVVGAKKYSANVTLGDGKATGKFIWPVPSCKTIYGSFGYRGRRLHKGIDISGSGIKGKPIIAADGGTVVEVNTSGWGGGYGLYVIIDHGNGYRTRYAHCSALKVVKGQKVSQGQLIALVGSTGESYAYHCHFEILINGKPVNPVPYVK